MTAQTYILVFEPLGLRGKCRGDESLLAAARRLGLVINSICGGQGICHSCRIRLTSGKLTPPTANETQSMSPAELEVGWRLACQAYPRDDCRLSVPPESLPSAQRLQVEGSAVQFKLEPPVTVYQLRLPPPSLADQQADADRLLQALYQQHQVRCNKVDVKALHYLPSRLRALHWECQVVVRDDEIVAVSPPHNPLLGLAVDLGTTKIAVYLVDLRNGNTLASRGVVNPQVGFGEDIISRTTSAIKSAASARELQKLVVTAINGMAADMCAASGANPQDIMEAVIVGNTVMHHLLLGLPVRDLVLSPFIPVLGTPFDIKARDIGLHLSPGAYLHLPPGIAGFVGSDHVAMLLATGARKAKTPGVYLDIGTNTEVSLVAGGKIATVSCASGPAFEGGHIKNGMRAASGAIERVRITDKGIQYQTIDDAPPVGICGSGILDAMAQLYRAGIINRKGRFTARHPGLRKIETQREFLLASGDKKGSRDITITQQDIRELQLAKASIRTGIEVLRRKFRRRAERIGQVVIAGAFGTYIDVDSALTIGLLPQLPRERFLQVGNAAGIGAKLLLVSLSHRAEARAIASRARYIELAHFPDFNRIFIKASYIGEYADTKGHREEFA